MSHTPTPEQSAITDFVRNDKRSLLINALAGSGKTSTLIMATHAMRPVTTLCVAFNKKIALELSERMPGHVECATLNSIGHKTWARTINKRLTVSTDKSYSTLTELISNLRPEEREEAGEAFASILRTIRLAKSSGYVPIKFKTVGKGLCTLEEFQASAVPASDVEPSDLFWFLVDRVLERSISDGFSGLIDFDDQLYLSTLFGGGFAKYSVTMVDEAQDLSPLNHRMLTLMFGDRLIAVGDPRQAIYAFRGASTSSMEEMKESFQMEELPLSVSFRCPKAVVRRAQLRVPHMTSPEWAAEGLVESLPNWSPTTPPDGSVVLCRNNAPLFRTAMAFIRSRRGVKLAGNEIGAGLVRLLKKLGKPDLDQAGLFEAIEKWRTEEIAKASHSRVAPINDRAECLKVFAEQGSTLKEAIAFAEHLFASTGPVEFMTIHKAKGLEFDNVYFLDPFLIPSKYSRQLAEFGDDAALQQEYNLLYVGQTRSKMNLFFVNSEDLGD